MRTKFSGILTLLLAFVVQITFAQEKTVTGTVTDGDGLPLPGVNVLLEGTSTGTQTDFDGMYSIEASEGDVLEFSYVGFQSQSIEIGTASTYDISMAAGNELDEVIVTGYSATTKQSFTGTATKIDAEKLSRKSVADISQALAGEAAGVRVINTSGQPGTSAAVRIRGLGSINGSTQPLYIVDGAPFLGDISAINPSDIESTTILKDAQATAIYGSRGANGVIVINTKRGRSGHQTIEVETRTGINVNLLPRYDVIESPERYIALSWEGLKNNALIGDSPNPINYANENLFSNVGISPKYNLWNVDNGAELIDPNTGMVRPGVTRKYNPEDWEDYAFQASNRQQADLRISGGNEKSSYYTSFGYLKDEGYSINSDYERLTSRLNITHQVTDWLTGSANIGYTYSDQNAGGQTEDSGSVFWFVDNIPPIYPLFLRDENGNILKDNIYGGNQYDYGEGRGFGALTNSIADANFNRNNTKKHELNTNFFFQIDFTDYLQLETRFGSQYYNSSYDNLTNPFYGSAANGTLGGSIYKEKEELFNYNFLQLLRFNKSFGNHSLQALVAHEANSSETKFIYGGRNQIVDPNTPEWNNAVVYSSMGSYTQAYTLESYFGQINYDFKNKYFLSGTLRRDGSSRFTEGNRWGTFGAIGLAWLISEESFMDNQNIFTSLKLKTSYGLIGEQGGFVEEDGTIPSSEIYYPGYDLNSVDNLNDELALSFYNKGSRNLTWEKSKMFQVGTEMRLFDKINLDIDYYNKLTDDLLFERRVAPSLGYAIVNVNDGELQNSGIEFTLNSDIIKNDDFTLNFSVNGEIIQNELKKMPIDPTTGSQKILDIQGIYGRSAGHSIYDFYMREWAGVDPETGSALWNQYYHDANGNGSLDSNEETISSLTQWENQNPGLKNEVSSTTTTVYQNATQKYVNKSAIPDLRGAFNLAAQYKNFSLSVQFLYSIGGYSYDGAYARLMSMRGKVGNNGWHKDILNRWQKPGDITDVPRITSDLSSDANFASTSTRFITKSDYLALNNIRLGYELSPNYFEKIGLDKINIFATGDNLWLLSERDGFNPSTSINGASDTYRYSPLSTFTVGINAKF